MVKLNNQGVTLVEMLIAAGILGILALVMGSLFMNQSREQSNLHLRATFDSLTNSVQSQVSNPAILFQSANQTEVQNVANPN